MISRVRSRREVVMKFTQIYVVLQRLVPATVPEPRLIHQHLVATLTVHHIVAASGGTP